MTDDRHDDLLRQILASHAETIVPKGDGLMNIQARTASRGARPRWLVPAAALATAAAVVAGFVIGGQLLGGGDEDSLTPLPLASQTAPSEQPTSTPGSPTPTPATDTEAVPVYYLHDDGQSLRLYREFHRMPAMASDASALQEALTGAPNDPDYTSLWPKDTRVLSVTPDVSTGLAVVDLSAEATRQTNAGAEGEARSVQQIVYTLTAFNSAIKRVELRVAGKKVTDLWGHGFGANPQGRAPATDVQGFVWLLQPTQGATAGSPLTISGIACTFEATVNIEVVKAGKVVKTLHTMTDGGCPHFGPFSIPVELAPGDYLIRAFESSAKDGSATYVDDKAVTVK